MELFFRAGPDGLNERFPGREPRLWPYSRPVIDQDGTDITTLAVAGIALDVPPQWPDGLTDLVWCYAHGGKVLTREEHDELLAGGTTAVLEARPCSLRFPGRGA